MIHDCYILYLHHADDALTRHHLRVLRQNNPFPVLAIHADQLNHLPEAVNIGRVPGGNVWPHSDMAFVGGFRHRRQDARRYLWIEYDTLATQPVEHFYAELWDQDVTAPAIRTPEREPQWPWFSHMPHLPPALQAMAVGMSPISGILLSHAAMECLAAADTPPVFSELRVGTTLRAAGFQLNALPPEKAANLHWDQHLVWPDSRIPSIYHPVKTLPPGV